MKEKPQVLEIVTEIARSQSMFFCGQYDYKAENCRDCMALEAPLRRFKSSMISST